MSIQVKDTFQGTPGTNLTAHVGETGATWTRHPVATGGAAWVLSDTERAYSSPNSYTAGGSGIYLASGVPASDDHDIQAAWHFKSYQGDCHHGILIRYNDTANSGYRLVYESVGPPTTPGRRWVLQKVTAGVVAPSPPAYAQALVAGTDYAILVECRSTGITVKIDGVTRITSADTTFIGSSQRRVGLYSMGSGTASNTAGHHVALLAVGDAGEALVADNPTAPSTVRTATVAGNWSDTATWGGQTPPGIGDSALIKAAVTHDVDVTVGTSGAAGSTAVTIDAASGGSLTFLPGRTLRVRGDMIVSGANSVAPASNVRLSMVAGCSLVFDATAAAAGVQYKLQVGTGHNQTPLILVRGTSSARCSIRSDTTGGALPAYFSGGGFINSGSIDAEYLDFADFGDATRAAWQPYMGSNDLNYFRLAHATLARCGKVSSAAAMTSGSTFILDDVKFSQTADAKGLAVSATGARTAGTRTIVGCVFDKPPDLFANDFDVTYNVFEALFSTINTGRFASFHHNFWRTLSQGGGGLTSDTSDCYFLHDGDTTNVHGFGLVTGIDADAAFERIVIESVKGGGGDFIFPHSPATNRITAVRNCILLPSDPAVLAAQVGASASYGSSPGKLVSMLNGPNANLVCEHNTMITSADTETGIGFGETFAGRAGQINKLRSNLFWSPGPGAAGYKLVRQNNSTVQDAAFAADVDYNWGWNLSPGSDGNGYHSVSTANPMFSVGTPDVHGGNGNPAFVDSTRNLAKWAVSRGSTATTDALRRADAIAYLRSDTTLIDDLLSYVRGGFAPTNPAMATAAHDGTTPGAVPLAAVAAPDTFVLDTFAGEASTDLLDHVGQLGAAWTVHPASFPGTSVGWRLDAYGRAYCYAGGYHASLMLASGVPDVAEYDVLATWRVLSANGDLTHGFLFGFDPVANSGYRLVYANYTKQWKLQRVTNGTATDLKATTAPTTLTVGSDYAIRVKVRTAGIEVFVGGVSTLTHGDTTYGGAGRRVGLYGYGDQGAQATTGLHLDRFAVTLPDATPPDYDLEGPHEGVPGLAAPFRVTLAPGVNPGSVTITPTAAGISGTFAPTSLTLTDSSRTGTFAFTQSGTAAGSGTIALGDNAGLTPPPAVAFVTGYGPPARLEAWRSRVHYTHATGANPFVAGTGYSLDFGEHYDPLRGIILARDYCLRADLPPTDWSVELAAELVRYRDRAVIGAESVPPWHHRYTWGLADHFRDAGDAADRAAIDRMIGDAATAADQYMSHGPSQYRSDMTAMWNARPAGFQLLAMIDREWAGLGAHSFMDLAAAALLEMFATVTAPPGTFYGNWYKTFFLGIALRASLVYWDRYRDATSPPARVTNVAAIPAAVLDVCDLLWETGYWPPDGVNGPAHGGIGYEVPDPADMPAITGITVQAVTSWWKFTGPSSLSTVDDYYKYCRVNVGSGTGFCVGYAGATRTFTLSQYWEPITVAPGMALTISTDIDQAVGANGPTPDLNPMVAPAFAWAYWYCKRVLGDHAAAVVHRARHDELFSGQQMSWGNPGGQKQWNQAMWWTTLGFDWRDRGDAEWPAATTFALEAPALGASGPHSTRSAPFRLSLARGVKADTPIHVTPASSTGRGTFAPADVILSSDRPTAMFVFTPDALDSGSTATISAAATGLTAPAPIAYAVTSGATANRHTFRVGPRFDRSPLTRSSLVRY